MTEPLLSDDEIRDLLRQSPAGGGEVGHLWEGETAPYDLLKAASKVKDKIAVADQIAQAAASLLQKSLAEICGGDLRLEFSKHDSLPASEAVAEISPETSLVAPWSDRVKNLEGLFRVDRRMFFTLYGKMLGGSGTFEKKGPLTLLEKVFLGRVLEPVVAAVEQSWKPYGDWTFSLGEPIEDAEKMSRLGWNFDCLRASFKVSLPDQEGEISVLLPKDFLNGLGKETGETVEFEESPELCDRQWSDAVHEAIMDIRVPIMVRAGSMEMSLRQALELKPGEEFALYAEDGGTIVYVRGQPMFRASVGAVEKNRAVQIVSRIQEVLHE